MMNLGTQNVLFYPVGEHKNIIRPKAGFNKKVIDELIIKARHLKENQRYMSFIMDEIKVQQNLVYDEYTLPVNLICRSTRPSA